MQWIASAPVGLVTLAVVLATAGLLLSMKVEQELTRLETEAMADGIALTFADLRSSRPESTPLFTGPVEESATAFLLSAEAAGHGSNVDYKNWPWYKITRKLFDTQELTPEEMDEARALLEANREFVKKLKAVAQLPPTPMQDIIRLSHMDEDFFRCAIPNLPAFLSLVQLLLLDALVAHLDGNDAKAFESIGYSYELSDHVMDFPNLITFQLTWATRDSATHVLARIVLEAEPSDEIIRHLDGVLRQSVRPEALPIALQSELIGGRRLIEKIVSQHRTWQGAENPYGLEDEVRTILYCSRYFTFLRAQDEAALLSVFRQYIATVRLPYREASQVYAQLQEHVGALKQTEPIIEALVLDIEGSLKSKAAHEVEICQARIALALCAYKRDHGQYPETLASLVPDYLSEVPIDAFSGAEMHYVRKDPAYVLYSAGPDGVDQLDGEEGTHEHYNTVAGISVAIADEIVWGMLWDKAVASAHS